ncbi:hypothetical protein CALCODRAFT_178739 [Calocera cornea HHB12733]|uniref:Uncharacterized protein n=1 Tax=Calocera cornea HHB12733 TaxID=1353952 RepID=A0A165CDL0_9BASI|nr:hypothetical protein CALCODRAFT_178739 [Calocera cornea HHB12733]
MSLLSFSSWVHRRQTASCDVSDAHALAPPNVAFFQVLPRVIDLTSASRTASIVILLEALLPPALPFEHAPSSSKLTLSTNRQCLIDDASDTQRWESSGTPSGQQYSTCRIASCLFLLVLLGTYSRYDLSDLFWLLSEQSYPEHPS